MTPGAQLMRGMVRAYRLLLSPILPMSCRYRPSCSEYAMTAFARHGAVKGGWLTARRLARCHPWAAGGDDPVPEPMTAVAGNDGDDAADRDRRKERVNETDERTA